MNDTYQPEPATTALCPYCGATVQGAPDNWDDLVLVTLMWRCPQCAAIWQERREETAASRYW